MVNESKKTKRHVGRASLRVRKLQRGDTTIGFLIGENLRAIKNPTTDSQARPSLSA